MVQIEWTIQAKEDLKEIAHYIGRDSQKYAKIQVVRIRTKTRLLKRHIKIGKITPEINNPEIRELIEGNYRIIYKILNNHQIVILTVHHTSRDFHKRRLI